MELCTATGKSKRFFLTTRDVWCVHHRWHGTHQYSSSYHTCQHGCIDILTHTLASSSSRNVNYDEKQLSGKKILNLFLLSVKVKVKVLCNKLENPEGGGRGIALHSLDISTRRGWVAAPRPSRFTPGKDPVPIVWEAGWSPGPVWTCVKNLAPTRIRSPDCPAHSQSLYWLSYPGPVLLSVQVS
jgi:hypothetical protein